MHSNIVPQKCEYCETGKLFSNEACGQITRCFEQVGNLVYFFPKLKFKTCWSSRAKCRGEGVLLFLLLPLLGGVGVSYRIFYSFHFSFFFLSFGVVMEALSFFFVIWCKQNEFFFVSCYHKWLGSNSEVKWWHFWMSSTCYTVSTTILGTDIAQKVS